MINNMGIPTSPSHSSVSEIVVDVRENPGSRTPEGMNSALYFGSVFERFPEKYSGSCLPLKSACRSIWKGMTNGENLSFKIAATGITIGGMALLAGLIYLGVKGQLHLSPSPNAN